MAIGSKRDSGFIGGNRDVSTGIWLAGSSYLLWGLLPIYWKQLVHVPPAEIVTHRGVWSLGFVVLLLAMQRRWAWIGGVARSPRTLLTFAASMLLLSVNWFLYIWAVNASFIVETSLGYFFVPFVNTALGVIFLRERLRRGQLLALAIAGTGVAYLTVQYGSLPWIALTLAFTFGLYGLIRKTAPIGSLEGLAIETAMVFVPALGYLILLGVEGRLVFLDTDAGTLTLLALSGALTAVPLLLFGAGARLIPMTMLGVLQYIAPTLQLLLGVFAYGEPMSSTRLIGFGFVWLALLIYTVEGVRHRRQPSPEREALTEPPPV